VRVGMRRCSRAPTTARPPRGASSCLDDMHVLRSVHGLCIVTRDSSQRPGTERSCNGQSSDGLVWDLSVALTTDDVPFRKTSHHLLQIVLRLRGRRSRPRSVSNARSRTPVFRITKGRWRARRGLLFQGPNPCLTGHIVVSLDLSQQPGREAGAGAHRHRIVSC
jgi:hypothetical protein